MTAKNIENAFKPLIHREKCWLMTRADLAASASPAPVRTASSRCRLCRTFKRYNEKTKAAIREADDIMRDIIGGKRKPKTLNAMFAEIAAI